MPLSNPVFDISQCRSLFVTFFNPIYLVVTSFVTFTALSRNKAPLTKKLSASSGDLLSVERDGEDKRRSSVDMGALFHQLLPRIAR